MCVFVLYVCVCLCLCVLCVSLHVSVPVGPFPRLLLCRRRLMHNHTHRPTDYLRIVDEQHPPFAITSSDAIIFCVCSMCKRRPRNERVRRCVMSSPLNVCVHTHDT
jgi:hypothetical protein